MPRLCAWRALFALALVLLVAGGCGRTERPDIKLSDNATLPPGLSAALNEQHSAGADAPSTRLANTTTPRGYANSTLTRGYANSTLPQGYANRTLPRGYANSTLPSGYANRTLPGGYAVRTLPQGYANSTLPAGYGNSTLPAGYGAASERSSMNSTLPGGYADSRSRGLANSTLRGHAEGHRPPPPPRRAGGDDVYRTILLALVSGLSAGLLSLVVGLAIVSRADWFRNGAGTASGSESWKARYDLLSDIATEANLALVALQHAGGKAEDAMTRQELRTRRGRLESLAARGHLILSESANRALYGFCANMGQEQVNLEACRTDYRRLVDAARSELQVAGFGPQVDNRLLTPPERM